MKKALIFLSTVLALLLAMASIAFADYTVPPIPTGFTWVTGTWSTGYVIQDGSGNQWVWVPVGGTTGGFAQRDWPLQDITKAETTDTVPSTVTDAITATGGFYVARYEMSNNAGVAQSKTGVAVWNNIDWDTANTAGASMGTALSYPASVSTHLIYDTEWDTMMQWMQDGGANVGTDSTSWGNYTPTTGALQNTGSNVAYMQKNISDVSGNVWEWTQGVYSSYRAERGGDYQHGGSICPAAYRGYDTPTSTSSRIGLRVAFVVLYSNTAPTVTVSSPSTNQSINASGTVTISGTVTDPDASQTETISATVNGVPKSTTVASPTAGGAWSLSWSGVELTEGSYPADITVTASDGTDTGTATYTGDITVTAAPGPLVPAVTMMELRDLTNNDSASDIRVLFRGAANESNIASYKIIVSKGTIDEATASGLPATSYMALAKKGNLRLYLTCLPTALITSSGGSINSAEGEYNVYVLSVGKTGYSDKLSTPLSITIITNNSGKKVTVSTPTVADSANNGNGTDLKVSIRKPKSEANIEAYRIIASTTDLTLTTAQNVPVAGYTSFTPTATGISYIKIMGAEQKDNGGITAIQNGTAYKVYVLAIGKNNYANVLSSPSKLITLSQYVPATNAVKSLKAIKVGSGHDSSNIGVSFYEPVSVSNVQEYRVFISPSGSTLDQATADGISNAVLYQVVATTGRGKSHTVTLDTGKKDYSDAALDAGSYKVYVLAVGKAGYAGKLSVASGNVTLD